MNDKIVLKSAKSFNIEKHNLDKLNKQIDNLREKEENLKHEIEVATNNLQNSRIKEQDIKELNNKIKMNADEEIMRNKKDHNELAILREMKNSLQKDLARVMQENLNTKYGLQSLREQRGVLENNLKNLQETYSQVAEEKENYNQELLQYKQEYDELMQLYELKKTEDIQLKSLYKFHFK